MNNKNNSYVCNIAVIPTQTINNLTNKRVVLIGEVCQEEWRLSRICSKDDSRLVQPGLFWVISLLKIIFVKITAKG